MLHPLLIFDGDTGQLVAAVLRPGTAHASRGAVAVRKRLLPRLRAAWPEAVVEVRAESGFASPARYEYCEAERVGYTIGLIPNPALAAPAAPLLAEAEARQAASADPAADTVRLVSAASYQAGSWGRERRVVDKAEALPQGPNARFVATSRADAPLAPYDWYVARGETANRSKDFKRACHADRLSCHRFLANQFRLLLHAAADWLLDPLRHWLTRAGAAPARVDTLRTRLRKVGGRVYQQAARVRLRLATGHPGQPLWALLAARPTRP
jgi:hypothetical protein